MSRDNILASITDYKPDQRAPITPAAAPNLAQQLDLLEQAFTAARARVVRCQNAGLTQQINALLDEYGVEKLCYGLEAAVRPWVSELPPKVKGWCYTESIEDFRKELFHNIDAGLTGCDAALAETGSLVLASSVKRPRMLSLVPPLHIAVVKAEQVHYNMASWLAAVDPANMPSNYILISGPSKSADIEQVLAYGVHGPKTLVVVLVEPD